MSNLNTDKLRAIVLANPGAADTAILALANATSRTGIDLDALDAYLSKTLNGAGAALKLALVAASTNAQLPAALTNALAAFLNFLDSPRHSTLDYADSVVGPQVDATLGGCVQAGLMTQAQANAIAAMGTVWPCDAPVQQSDVDAMIASVALDQQAASLANWLAVDGQTAQGQVDAWRRAGAFPSDAKAQLQAIFDPTK